MSHVAEFRFHDDLPNVVAEMIGKRISETLRECGVDDVEFCLHDDMITISWREPLDDNLPNKGQRWVFQDALEQLYKASRGASPTAERARAMIAEIREVVSAGQLTKKNCSQMIDAIQDALADLRFEQKRNGRHVAEVGADL